MTLWEENGTKVTDTILNMDGNMQTMALTQDGLNSSIQAMNSDPMVRLQEALLGLKEAFAPILEVVAEFIAKMADWMANNTELVAVIAGIGVAIGLVVAGFMLLAPIVVTIGGLMGGLGATLGAVLAPVLAIVAGIALLVAGFIYAYNEFEGFKNAVDSTFSAIKDLASQAMEAVVGFVKEKLEELKAFWDENGAQILLAVENAWNLIKGVFDFVLPLILWVIEDVWGSIKDVISTTFDIIMGVVKVFTGLFTGDWDTMWEGIKEVLSGALSLVWELVQLWFIGKVLKIFKSFVDKGVDFIKDMWSKIKGKFEDIVQLAKDKFEQVKGWVVQKLENARDMAITVVENLKEKFRQKLDDIKSTARDKFEEVKGFITKPIEKARDLVELAIDKIKGFFTNMKLKFPEIKMPKLPHFKLTGDFSLNPPRVPKLGIDWYAKGGIMTQPTAFGMNGSNLMVGGEAGAEAILPLTDRVLGAIGEGIASLMGTNGQPQTQVINIAPAPVNLDGEKIGEILFDTINVKQSNDAVLSGIMRGVKV